MPQCDQVDHPRFLKLCFTRIHDSKLLGSLKELRQVLFLVRFLPLLKCKSFQMNDNLHNFQKCHILNLTSECDGHSTWRSCWQHLRLYVTKRLHEILHIFYNIFHILDDYAGRKNLKMQIQIWKWPKIANFCITSRLYS